MNVRRRQRSASPARRRRAVSSILLAVAATSLPGPAARAVDKFYIGPAAGFWDTSTNWNPSGQPAPGDNVAVVSGIIAPATTVTADNFTPPTSTNLTLLYIDTASFGGIRLNQVGSVISESNAIVGFTNTGELDLSSSAVHGVSGTLFLGYQSAAFGSASLGGAASLQVAGTEVIGYSGRAFLNQIGGTNAVPNFDVGFALSGNGTVNLAAGLLNVSSVSTVGLVGTGWYFQSGGTHSANTLLVGEKPTAIGHYAMTNGALAITGGATIGDEGFGTFVQSGGTTTIGSNLQVAAQVSGAGSFSVFGGGATVSGNAYIGVNGTLGGTFNQSAGTFHVGGTGGLYFGYAAGVSGSASLLGTGILQVTNNEYVGYGGLGAFAQSAGSNSASQLLLGNLPGSSGTFTLSGGTLTIGQEFPGVGGPGTFIQSGGSHVTGFLRIGQAGAGSYSMTNGTLINTAEVSVGYSGVGTFTQSGGTVSGGAWFIGDFGGGSGTYTLSNGVLTTQSIAVGWDGRGTFTQNGGTHTTGALTIGADGGSGIYTLSGGSLLASDSEYVGFFSTGVYIQSGGDNHVSGTGGTGLYIGYNVGATGSGSLSAGSLRVEGFDEIGASGIGTFTQTGGTHSAGFLRIGVVSSGNGTYTLSGGNLNVVGSLNVGDGGRGTFIQSGGSVTAAFFDLGDGATGSGTANISGAASIVLSTDGIIGNAGAGVLNQSGGTISTPSLEVGRLVGGSGTYSLSGGTLNVTGTTTVSNAGRGAFNLSGGLHTTGGLTIGAAGTYTQTGGTVNASATLNNGSFTQIAGQASLGTVTGSTGTMTLGVASGNASKTTVNTLVQPTVIVNNTGFLQFAIFPGVTPHHTNTITSLAISGTGRVDLANQDLLTSTPAAAIRSYLVNAYTPAGDWSGPGLNSVFAMTSSIKYTVGYADGNDLSANDARPDVPAGRVLVRPTLVGDANLDGKVDFFDISQVLGYKYNTGAPASYTDGDLNYDGVVDFFDLTVVLSANYNSGAVFGLAAAASADAPNTVPEPVGIGVLGIGGAAGLLSRRRRRRRYFVASDTFTRDSRVGASLPPSPPVLTATPSAMRSPGLAMICSSPLRPATTSTVVP
jgi:hypothetical protein